MNKCAGLAGLLLALTACGAGGTGSGEGAATAESSTTEPSASRTPTAPGTAHCTTGVLRVSVGPGEGAAGSTYLPVRLTNTSDTACRTRGFGGVSLVTGPRSEPVGAPADRTRRGDVATVTLRPGERAEATLRVTNAENYPADRCRPSPTAGLRVYPPDETRSVYVRYAATACGSARVHLLTLTPYRRAG